MATTTKTPDTYPHDLAGPEADAPTTPPADLVVAWREFEAQELGDLEAGPPLQGAATTKWRMAGSLQALLQEADAANPARDKSSDGGVGDLRHQANWTSSDHNPFVVVAGTGVVRARDFDVDGLDVAGTFERIRQGVLAGRLPQLEAGGYLIHAGRITSPDFRAWREYVGANPHVTHGHVSVSREAARFDDRRSWGVWAPPAPAPAPTPPPAPTGPGWTGPDLTGSGLSLRGNHGDSGGRVQALQAWLLKYYPAYARDGLGPDGADGWWGDRTTGVLAEFAARSGIRGADGRNVGPQIARKLYLAGFRG